MRIRHKALRRFAATDDPRGLPAPFAPKLKRILSLLAEAQGPEGIAGAYGAHPMRADFAGYWSLRVSGNWRVICRFSSGEAVDIDLIDYH